MIEQYVTLIKIEQDKKTDILKNEVLEGLRLKDAQFYKSKFEQAFEKEYGEKSGDKLKKMFEKKNGGKFKNFDDGFKVSSEIYHKLGQFDFSRQFEPNPSSEWIGSYQNGEKYIYIGQCNGYSNTEDGIGIQVWSDGNIYESCFKDGKRDGRGRAIANSGNYYIGEWKDSKLNGQGSYYYNDGDRYEGEFRNNKSDGQGTYYYNDRSKYVGEWKDDIKHGQGTLFSADGKVEKTGKWENDKFKG